MIVNRFNIFMKWFRSKRKALDLKREYLKNFLNSRYGINADYIVESFCDLQIFILGRLIKDFNVYASLFVGLFIRIVMIIVGDNNAYDHLVSYFYVNWQYILLPVLIVKTLYCSIGLIFFEEFDVIEKNSVLRFLSMLANGCQYTAIAGFGFFLPLAFNFFLETVQLNDFSFFLILYLLAIIFSVIFMFIVSSSTYLMVGNVRYLRNMNVKRSKRAFIYFSQSALLSFCLWLFYLMLFFKI